MEKSCFKTIASFALATTMLVGCTSAFAAELPTPHPSEVSSETIISPRDLEIAEGTATGSQFTRTVAVTSRNGERLNFWVHNRGTSNVDITIDNKKKRTLKPGEQGHIYITLGFFTQNHTCKAVPSPNGGSLNIEYRIAQRDVN